ncbi:MAG TPA: ParB/RepB/Spo0J family partition protein [Acetobacteraceae bacterium]|nr:ParB/RepB/Spo0J family partition protein [Acetobacteraceae bacterium]
MATRSARRPLGRGLAALLGDMKVAPPGPTPAATGGAASQSGLRQIPLDLLDPNPYQPRMVFAQEALEELAASIRARGILQPILVRAHPSKPERFYIVAGERRWRAAALAGLHEVPAILRDMSEAEAGLAALIENLQREDLNPIEEAEGYNRLLDELGVTQETLAEAVGKSRTHVTNILRLLNLPESVQAEVRKGALSFAHARALLAHPDPESLAAAVFQRGLTARQTEALATRDATGKRRPSARKPGGADLGALEQRLVERLGYQTRVTMGRQGHVSVVLEFTDLHQLEAWMDGLTG